MDRETFWKIIDDAKPPVEEYNLDDHIRRYCEQLALLSAEDLVKFGRIQRDLMREAYGYPLWDAANIINGYCSDDSFSHFRVGVIAQGGEVFYKALREPDTLAELPRNQAKSMIRCEYLDYGPSLVYQERFPGSEEDFDSGLGPAEPYGGDFKDTELLLRQYYPRLFEKYWNDNIQSDEEAEV